jgi:hypothetical protein
MSLGLVQPHYLEISADDFVPSHPELHHYTNFSGLSGVVKSNTIWATHYDKLNDTSEITLLRDPLTKAVTNRLRNYFLIRQGTDFEFHQFITQHGGAEKVATSEAQNLINILYGVTFGGLAEPFIASFCSHASDQCYEREHGLLSQWRGYGGDDGRFCIVFETAELIRLLIDEFNMHNWVQLKIVPVCYSIDKHSVESAFPELLKRCEYFFTEAIDGKPPIAEGGLAPFFMAGATCFKHQGFREEREVRIVAIPTNRKILAKVLDKNPEYGLPNRMKQIRIRESTTSRYIALFDKLGAILPIKRVIVGPSINQTENYARARSLITSGIPVTCSAIPFSG